MDADPATRSPSPRRRGLLGEEYRADDIANDTILIVENRLATTDHSHLGQVLKYAAGTGASTIIWIAAAFREGHRHALDWSNESTGEKAHFFGIELQLVEIGDTQPAPLFAPRTASAATRAAPGP